MIRNSKLGCVAERTDGNIENWINKFRTVLKDIALLIQEGSFIENVVSYFYNDDIRVFTPKGDAIILPLRATALDFAYEILGDRADQAQYARVNGNLCSVKTVLQRGDCVEIGTNENISPSPELLNHVLTYKAKQKLESRFKKKKISPYTRCSHCHPLPGEELIGFRKDKKNVIIHKRNCSEAILLATREGDSIIDVNFEEDLSVLYPVSIQIKAVDRFHLFRDLTYCISEKLKLSMSDLKSTTVDEIVDCTINFTVHSARELQDVITSIYNVEGVDEVRKLNLEEKER
jgi:GTP pyrophosphokinase